MGDLLNHLDFWLAIFTLGAMGYFLLWKDLIQPVIRSLLPPPPDSSAPSTTTVRTRLLRRPRPIRSKRGRFAGSRPAAAAVPTVPLNGNDVERSSEGRSASESDVPDGNEVPAVSVSEVVQITAQLVRGVSPSDVAKSLPGYSARNYKAYMAKVRQVAVELDSARSAAQTPTQQEAPQ